jgi:hypothetical protein
VVSLFGQLPNWSRFTPRARSAIDGVGFLLSRPYSEDEFAKQRLNESDARLVSALRDQSFAIEFVNAFRVICKRQADLQSDHESLFRDEIFRLGGASQDKLPHNAVVVRNSNEPGYVLHEREVEESNEMRNFTPHELDWIGYVSVLVVKTPLPVIAFAPPPKPELRRPKFPNFGECPSGSFRYGGRARCEEDIEKFTTLLQTAGSFQSIEWGHLRRKSAGSKVQRLPEIEFTFSCKAPLSTLLRLAKNVKGDRTIYETLETWNSFTGERLPGREL